MLLVEHEDVEVGTTIQRYTWRLWTDSYLVNVVIRNNSDRRLDVNPQEIRLVDREKLRYVQHQNIDEMVEDQAKFDTISENAADHILSEVLLRTTLFPDESIQGSVWYRHDGKQLSIQIPVHGLILEFPFVFTD